MFCFSEAQIRLEGGCSEMYKLKIESKSLKYSQQVYK